MRLLAWLLVVLGILAVLLGAGLFVALRRFAHWPDREARELWHGMGRLDVDPALIRGPVAEEALDLLQRHDPPLAARTRDGLRRYAELREADSGAFGDVRRLARRVVVAGYVAPALVLAGCLAAVAGILQLR